MTSGALLVQGGLLREQFEAKTPALALLKAAIACNVINPKTKNRYDLYRLEEAKKLLAEAGFPVPKHLGYLVGLDGRRLHVHGNEERRVVLGGDC